MVKVSVIIPARNEEEYIAACLDSLMKQTKKPFEIVVVTNNSTDKTKEIVDGYKGKGVKQIIFNGKSSAAIARNRGARVAKGDVFFFLDADVFCAPTLIGDIERVFSNPGVEHAVAPTVANVNSFIQRCNEAKVSYLRRRREAEKIVSRSVNIIRRNLFEKIGGYPEDVFYFEDRALWEEVKGYRQGDMKSTTYYNDPGTLDEFIRQAKYMGKGLSTYGLGKLLKDNPSLRIAVYSFSFISALLALILLLSPNRTVILGYAALIMAVALISYGLIRAMVYSVYSKMPLESFTWVFVLAPIRLFFMGSEYLENKLKSQQ